MRYFVKDAGQQYANRYTLFKIEPIKLNTGAIHNSVQYYGCFKWTPSTTHTAADILKLREISAAVANRIKKYIQQ